MKMTKKQAKHIAKAIKELDLLFWDLPTWESRKQLNPSRTELITLLNNSGFILNTDYTLLENINHE